MICIHPNPIHITTMKNVIFIICFCPIFAFSQSNWIFINQKTQDSEIGGSSAYLSSDILPNGDLVFTAFNGKDDRSNNLNAHITVLTNDGVVIKDTLLYACGKVSLLEVFTVGEEIHTVGFEYADSLKFGRWWSFVFDRDLNKIASDSSDWFLTSSDDIVLVFRTTQLTNGGFLVSKADKTTQGNLLHLCSIDVNGKIVNQKTLPLNSRFYSVPLVEIDENEILVVMDTTLRITNDLEILDSIEFEYFDEEYTSMIRVEDFLIYHEPGNEIIFKLDFDFNILDYVFWESEENVESFFYKSILADSNSNVVMAYTENMPNQQNHLIHLRKLDQNLEEIWHTIAYIDVGLDHTGISISSTSDDGVVVMGGVLFST